MKQLTTDGYVTIRVKHSQGEWMEEIGRLLQERNADPDVNYTRAVVMGRLLRVAESHDEVVRDARVSLERKALEEMARAANHTHADTTMPYVQVDPNEGLTPEQIRGYADGDAKLAAKSAKPAKPPARKPRR